MNVAKSLSCFYAKTALISLLVASLSGTQAKAAHWEITITYSGIVRGEAQYNSNIPSFTGYVKDICTVNGLNVPPYLNLATAITPQTTTSTSVSPALQVQNYTTTIAYGSPLTWSATQDRNPFAPGTDPLVNITISYTWKPDNINDLTPPPSGVGSWKRRISITDVGSQNIYIVGPPNGNFGTATSYFTSKYGVILPGEIVTSPNNYRHTFISYPNSSNLFGILRDEPIYVVDSVTGPPYASHSTNNTWPASDVTPTTFAPGSGGSFSFQVSWDLFSNSIVSGSGLGSGSGTIADLEANFAIDFILP